MYFNVSRLSSTRILLNQNSLASSFIIVTFPPSLFLLWFYFPQPSLDMYQNSVEYNHISAREEKVATIILESRNHCGSVARAINTRNAEEFRNTEKEKFDIMRIERNARSYLIKSIWGVKWQQITSRTTLELMQSSPGQKLWNGAEDHQRSRKSTVRTAFEQRLPPNLTRPLKQPCRISSQVQRFEYKHEPHLFLHRHLHMCGLQFIFSFLWDSGKVLRAL